MPRQLKPLQQAFKDDESDAAVLLTVRYWSCFDNIVSGKIEEENSLFTFWFPKSQVSFNGERWLATDWILNKKRREYMDLFPGVLDFAILVEGEHGQKE